MGGDGTLNEVANGIMLQKRYASHEVKVGVVPIGTGNDWIKTADIPTNTNDAINIICAGNTSLQDIGRATYQINNSKHVRYFVNTAGSGLDSIVINKVSQKKTRSKNKGTNKLVYILTLLAEFTKYKPIEVTLETDNDTTLKGNMLNFAIGIGKYNGGGMLPFPNANPGNNLFEVLFISNMPKIRMLFALPKLFSGTLDKVKEVKYIRSKKIKLSSTTPIFAETDGEVIGYTPILFDIEPLAFCYFSK
jgi:YegS/Rv2252/BmrU family lipid kinase